MLNERSVKQRIAETENVFYNMKNEFWQLTSATRNNKKRRVRALVAESVKDTIDWKTLLTTIVENLHAVSRFKHETFDPFNMLQTSALYRRNRSSELPSGGRNFTHTSSYHLVPQTFSMFYIEF